MISVGIGFPTRGADVHYRLIEWLLRQVKRTDMLIGVHITEGNLSAKDAERSLFSSFPTDKYDYVLLLDSDVVPPDDAIDKLVRADKDIIVAPVWCFDPSTNDIHLNIHYTLDTSIRTYLPDSSGLERIMGSSLSICMLKNKVLQIFRDKNESFVDSSKLIEDSKLEHNDNVFFAKCAKLGIEVWVDWSVGPTHHIRKVDLCNATIHRLYTTINEVLAKNTIDK